MSGNECRRMETRTCPPSGPCGAICARFESEDTSPWSGRRKLRITNFGATIGEAEIDDDAKIVSVMLSVENLDLILPGYVLGEGLSMVDVARTIVPLLHVDIAAGEARFIKKGIFGQ